MGYFADFLTGLILIPILSLILIIIIVSITNAIISFNLKKKNIDSSTIFKRYTFPVRLLIPVIPIEATVFFLQFLVMFHTSFIVLMFYALSGLIIIFLLLFLKKVKSLYVPVLIIILIPILSYFTVQLIYSLNIEILKF